MRPVVAALLSGTVWGVFGALLLSGLGNHGMAWTASAGPLIGYAVFRLSGWSYRRSIWWIIPWAVVSTYLAVALFGVARGVVDAVHPRGAIGWRDIVEGVVVCVWGLTIFPIFWWLFAVAAGNHLLIRWLVGRQRAITVPMANSGMS